MSRKLIIGLGTGRCGSVSLVKFLASQSNFYMIHEGRHERGRQLIKWYNDETQVLSWLGELESISKESPFFGDTGFYFLPYTEMILQNYPNARFVCLERNREAVIGSYLKKTSDGRNFWYKHDGRTFRNDQIWDATYPKFDEPDKKVSIGLYWDMYHTRAIYLQANHKDNFRIFSMDTLNSTEGLHSILDFIGYADERNVGDIFHDNSRNKNRNFRYWLKQKLRLA